MKTLACLLIVTWLALVVAIFAVALPACSAPVQIHVRAEQWQCPAEVHNENGTVDFKGCSKIDGDSPVDQKAEDGKDELKVSAVGHDPRLN